MGVTLHQLLKTLVERGGSDLHLTTNSPPMIRVDGDLIPLDYPPLAVPETKQLAYSILTDVQKHRFEEQLELDLSFGVKGLARFRGNCFLQRGAVSAVFRQIPYEILGFRELGVPNIVEGLCNKPRCLVLVTGPTGSGKSTTLATMLDKINREQPKHIVTIEDPIEFLHTHKRCIVNQRELHADTHSFPNALKAVLREDPDVVLIGEMRDLETMEMALRVAETGHLTLATLHTNSAVQTMNRIIDSFPANQQSQVRAQLSFVLEGILCQSLLPRTSGKGRCMAMEILIPTPAIRNLIREDKLHQIYSMMQTGQNKYGMQTFNQSLATLVHRRVISQELAMSVSSLPDELAEMIARGAGDVTTVKEKGKELAVPKLGGGSVSARRLAIFTRQFSVMIDAGLPLVQCLEILGSQQDSRLFQKIILAVRQDVEAGSSLSEAMRKHPKAFDDLFVNMVAAGEAGGILDTILRRLSTYIEKAVKLKSQVKTALIYPVAVLSVAAIVVFIILWKVIPTFASLFAALGAELPLPTRLVIKASNFVASYILFIVAGIFALGYFLKRYYATYRGRRVIDGIVLKTPILGDIMRKIAVARFCRTLATLTSSGVPILDGLEITAKTAGNAIVEDAIMGVRKSVEAGRTIAEPLGETKVFPSMVVQMIGVGEQTGALDQMLNKIAEFYEEEVDNAVTGLMKLMEPVMIAILGVVIGTIVVAMYMPMFDLISKIN